MNQAHSSPIYWRYSAAAIAACTAAGLILGLLFLNGLARMVTTWYSSEEYSHGFLIPVISGYLIWQRRATLSRLAFTGAWSGVGMVLFGLLLFVVGELSAIYTLVQYAFLIVLYGVVLSILGWRTFKVLLVPLLILAFMIPLPVFLYNNLSSQLQLLSSTFGVAVVRLFGISVYLEGNVIDLGSYKLQVAEACNGLRYLFPLVTLGFIVAYFYHAAFWKRAVVFLSTIPITVLMNSFRIGVIAIMVNFWGQSMAEGFLHDFEGWAVFMACFGVLFLEMWLLLRLTNDRRPLKEVFGLEVPEAPPAGAVYRVRSIPKPFMAAAALLVLALVPALMLPQRAETIPPRAQFLDFPLAIGGWEGRRDALERIYIDALKFTDYVLVNYHNRQHDLVSFYVAYYESQRKGQSAHSPRSCLPGGGWRIESLTQQNIEGALVAGKPLRVNRVLISYGDQKQLVYYWFQQRGRVITNEYLVKWYMFLDAIRKKRTDGALVRLTTPLAPGEDPAKADLLLSQFSRDVTPELAKYIPD